jgi:hypothetical protein
MVASGGESHNFLIYKEIKSQKREKRLQIYNFLWMSARALDIFGKYRFLEKSYKIGRAGNFKILMHPQYWWYQTP